MANKDNKDNKIDIVIDGKKVKVNKDTNILQAAMDSGIYIPYLCYYPGMKSYGENILGFQTEDYANKRARLTDMTDTLGSLQKSDVWNNMFK